MVATNFRYSKGGSNSDSWWLRWGLSTLLPSLLNQNLLQLVFKNCRILQILSWSMDCQATEWISFSVEQTKLDPSLPVSPTWSQWGPQHLLTCFLMSIKWVWLRGFCQVWLLIGPRVFDCPGDKWIFTVRQKVSWSSHFVVGCTSWSRYCVTAPKRLSQNVKCTHRLNKVGDPCIKETPTHSMYHINWFNCQRLADLDKSMYNTHSCLLSPTQRMSQPPCKRLHLRSAASQIPLN